VESVSYSIGLEFDTSPGSVSTFQISDFILMFQNVSISDF